MFRNKNEMDALNSISNDSNNHINPLETINDMKNFLQNNLIFCPSCNTHLTPNWINLNEITLVCENQYVRNFS
jgi:hypothetical protein